MKKLSISIVGALLCSFGAHAANYTCTGEIINIYQANTGYVYLTSTEIYGDDEGRKICNLNKELKGAYEWLDISAEVCKAWVSKLQAIKMAGQRVAVEYVDANTCKTQPKWRASSNPVGLKEGG